MELSLKHLGSHGGSPAVVIELTINGHSASITEDVTNLKGQVDESFISNLREIADELEEQNKLILTNHQ